MKAEGWNGGAGAEQQLGNHILTTTNSNEQVFAR
jgi:hypothetical protein